MNDHEDTNGSKKVLENKHIYLPIANVARIMKTPYSNGKGNAEEKCN